MRVDYTQCQQQDARPLIPAGAVVPFMVQKAVEGISKSSGRPQIALTLRAEYKGTDSWIFDYLQSAGKAAWRTATFCQSVGIPQDEAADNLAAEACEGAVGECEITIEPASGGFAARNKVGRYLPYVPPAERLGVGVRQQLKKLQADVDAVPENALPARYAVPPAKIAALAQSIRAQEPIDDDVPY